MEQPRGFKEGRDEYVWKLNKILYRTIQGAHDWAKNLDRTFEGHGYYKSKTNPQICLHVFGNEFMLTSTWTDNILEVSSTLEGKTLAKNQLGTSYKIKNLGEAKLILGICVDRDPTTGNIMLSQKAYCEQMLNRFNMSKCIPVSTPLPPGLTLLSNNCPTTTQEAEEIKNTPYHEALGSLMWLQVATWPDLSYTVNTLSCFTHNPGKQHWLVLKHALAYIRGKMHYGLVY